MPEARDIEGVALERSSVVLLARVAYPDGAIVLPSQVTTVRYWIDERPGCDGVGTPVAGHQSVSLTPADVLYATLQTTDEWSVDATGFNFRHELDVATNDALPTAGRAYLVRYELTPTVGQPVVLRFLIRAI